MQNKWQRKTEGAISSSIFHVISLMHSPELNNKLLHTGQEQKMLFPLTFLPGHISPPSVSDALSPLSFSSSSTRFHPSPSLSFLYS